MENNSLREMADDPGFLAATEQGQREIEEGRCITLAELKRELEADAEVPEGWRGPWWRCVCA